MQLSAPSASFFSLLSEVTVFMYKYMNCIFFKYDLIYRTTVIEFMEHVAKNNHLPCQHLDHC